MKPIHQIGVLVRKIKNNEIEQAKELITKMSNEKFEETFEDALKKGYPHNYMSLYCAAMVGHTEIIIA